MYQQQPQPCNVDQYLSPPQSQPPKKTKKYETDYVLEVEEKLNTRIQDNFADLLEHNKCDFICKILQHCQVHMVSPAIKERLKKQYAELANKNKI